MSEPKQFTSLVSEGKNPKYAILRFNALKRRVRGIESRQKWNASVYLFRAWNNRGP